MSPCFLVLCSVRWAQLCSLACMSVHLNATRSFSLQPLTLPLLPPRLDLVRILSCVFLAAVSLSAAAGFLLYGGRLFCMLRRFPIESRGRRKKLREVGCVTSICATCFTFRLFFAAQGCSSSETWPWQAGAVSPVDALHL